MGAESGEANDDQVSAACSLCVLDNSLGRSTDHVAGTA